MEWRSKWIAEVEGWVRMGVEAMRQALRGKTAVVTGASSGVGRATALAFAAAGVRVVLTARREERLQEVQRQIAEMGGEAVVYAGDAALERTAEGAVGMAVDRFGQVDILICNAGLGKYKQLVDTTVEEYDELMDANMRSSFVFARAAAPRFIAQRSGTIVFVSSVAGLAGKANEAVYAATKFAQVGFAQSLDDELRAYGVKVCVLCPGGVKTEFAVGHGRTAEGVAGSLMMEPQEVADTILFACMQPPNVRVIELTVRNMGQQK